MEQDVTRIIGRRLATELTISEVDRVGGAMKPWTAGGTNPSWTDAGMTSTHNWAIDDCAPEDTFS